MSEVNATLADSPRQTATGRHGRRRLCDIARKRGSERTYGSQRSPINLPYFGIVSPASRGGALTQVKRRQENSTLERFLRGQRSRRPARSDVAGIVRHGDTLAVWRTMTFQGFQDHNSRATASEGHRTSRFATWLRCYLSWTRAGLYASLRPLYDRSGALSVVDGIHRAEASLCRFRLADGDEPSLRRRCKPPWKGRVSGQRLGRRLMRQNVAEILGDCRLFATVESSSFQRLATMARLSRFDAGERVFREGQECPGAYVVGTGLVRVFKTSPSGKEHVLHMAGPGSTFAEVAAIGGFECPAHAEAVSPTTVVLLPQEPFRKALLEDHQLCLGMLTGLSLWVKHLVGLMEDVVLRDAAGRLARYLLECEADPTGLVRLPTLKRHLASHLNLTSETLSRMLRRLTDAGLIARQQGDEIHLLDRQRLAMVAQGLFPEI